MKAGVFFLRFLLLMGFLLLAVTVSPFLGSVSLPWEEVWQSWSTGEENASAQIFFQIRIPRVLLAAMVGAALAAAGVALQALLRNPLATPFTLGIAGGASLGAVLAIQFGLVITWQGLSSVSLFAGLGSLVAVMIVYTLGRKRGNLDTITLLLAGITVNFLFTAAVLFVHYIADPFTSRQITHWTMGSLDIVGYESLGGFGFFILIGLLPLLFFSRELNLLSVGEEEARSLGVDLGKTRAAILLGTSLAAGTAVAAAGPVGFVGLIVPHALRLLYGPDNRFLIPASLFAGGGFLVLCDTLGRSLVAGAEVPVGIITAFLGCPFFIWLLRRRRAVFF